MNIKQIKRITLKSAILIMILSSVSSFTLAEKKMGFYVSVLNSDGTVFENDYVKILEDNHIVKKVPQNIANPRWNGKKWIECEYCMNPEDPRFGGGHEENKIYSNLAESEVQNISSSDLQVSTRTSLEGKNNTSLNDKTFFEIMSEFFSNIMEKINSILDRLSVIEKQLDITSREEVIIKSVVVDDVGKDINVEAIEIGEKGIVSEGKEGEMIITGDIVHTEKLLKEVENEGDETIKSENEIGVIPETKTPVEEVEEINSEEITVPEVEKEVSTEVKEDVVFEEAEDEEEFSEDIVEEIEEKSDI